MCPGRDQLAAGKPLMPPLAAGSGSTRGGGPCHGFMVAKAPAIPCRSHESPARLDSRHVNFFQGKSLMAPCYGRAAKSRRQTKLNAPKSETDCAVNLLVSLVSH